MKNTYARSPLYTLLLLFVLSLTGCKKDKNDPAPDPTGFLTEKRWRIESMVVNPGIEDDNGNIITNLFALYDDCAKDDMTILNKNGSVSTDYGPLRCDPATPAQQITGSWTYTEVSKTLELVDNEEGTEIWIVKSSDNARLTLENKVSFPGYTVTMVLTNVK